MYSYYINITYRNGLNSKPCGTPRFITDIESDMPHLVVVLKTILNIIKMSNVKNVTIYHNF